MSKAVNPCICGRVPELVQRRETYGHGEFPLVAKLCCDCGLTSKEFIVDGFYGTTTTVDDLIDWWNDRFPWPGSAAPSEEVPGNE